MIYLYSGTPGAGKSYHATLDIYNSLCAGKNIISNYPFRYDLIDKINLGYYLFLDNSAISPDVFVEFASAFHKKNKDGRVFEGQSTIILDEAFVFFDNKSARSKNTDVWAQFFALHRHYGFNIILICQHDRMLAKNIRSCVEYNIIHKKASLAGGFITLFLPKKTFIAIKEWYGNKVIISKEFFRCKKKFFKFYDTSRVNLVSSDLKDNVKKIDYFSVFKNIEKK